MVSDLGVWPPFSIRGQCLEEESLRSVAKQTRSLKNDELLQKSTCVLLYCYRYTVFRRLAVRCQHCSTFITRVLLYDKQWLLLLLFDAVRTYNYQYITNSSAKQNECR